MTRTDTRKVMVEPTADEANRVAGELFKCIVCEAVGQRQVCRVALAGGTTPHTLYQRLADQATVGDVPWWNVEVFFGDERDVPHDDVESNYRMVQRTLLDHVPVEPTGVFPMPADAGNIEGAAENYEQIVRRNVPAGPDGIPRFDLVMLGMGGDGHTASLFPGTEAVGEQKKLVTAYFVPVLGRRRMTFTFPLINAARDIILLVTGADKAEVVAALLHDGAQKELPASLIQPTDGRVYIILDAPAARLTNFRIE